MYYLLEDSDSILKYLLFDKTYIITDTPLYFPEENLYNNKYEYKEKRR